MPPALTSLSHGAGCGCKLSAADLRPIVAGLRRPTDPRVLVATDDRRRRRRRPPHRRPRARPDRRLLHPDRRRPVRVRAHRRHQRAERHLRDGRRAGVGAQPRRVPARDARAGDARRRSCAAAATRSPPRARASSAATRSTTPSRSTASRSPAPCTPTRCSPTPAAAPGDALVLTKPLGAGTVATAIKRGLADDDARRAGDRGDDDAQRPRGRARPRGRRARAHRRHRLRAAGPRARAGGGERPGGGDRRRRRARDRGRARPAGDRGRARGRLASATGADAERVHHLGRRACPSRGGGCCATR